MSDPFTNASEVQAAALRRLSPEARLQLAVEMSATARALLGSRLRAAHPDWTEGQVTLEVLRYTMQEAGAAPPTP